jgi:subtilase family serine protease
MACSWRRFRQVTCLGFLAQQILLSSTSWMEQIRPGFHPLKIYSPNFISNFRILSSSDFELPFGNLPIVAATTATSKNAVKNNLTMISVSISMGQSDPYCRDTLFRFQIDADDSKSSRFYICKLL